MTHNDLFEQMNGWSLRRSLRFWLASELAWHKAPRWLTHVVADPRDRPARMTTRGVKAQHCHEETDRRSK